MGLLQARFKKNSTKSSAMKLKESFSLGPFFILSLSMHLFFLVVLGLGAWWQSKSLTNVSKQQVLSPEVFNVDLVKVTMKDVDFHPKDMKKARQAKTASTRPKAPPQKAPKELPQQKPTPLKNTGSSSPSISAKSEPQASEPVDERGKKGVTNGKNQKILMSYKDYLTNYLNSSKNYPRIAQKLRQEGMVILSLVIDTNGLIQELKVKKSSKFKVLDTAAFNHVKSLSPFKKLPSETLKAYKVEVPIVYQIN